MNDVKCNHCGIDLGGINDLKYPQNEGSNLIIFCLKCHKITQAISHLDEANKCLTCAKEFTGKRMIIKTAYYGVIADFTETQVEDEPKESKDA